jgi:hypothetical protein
MSWEFESTMSGPIVRTGTTPKFWENYDKVFGKAKSAAKPSAKKPARKSKDAKGKK